jgi:hypothetical protein
MPCHVYSLPFNLPSFLLCKDHNQLDQRNVLSMWFYMFWENGDVYSVQCNKRYLLHLKNSPSRHGPFFPCHVTASGHIEPGSLVHMRPGCETAYPFSPPPHHSCRRALDTVSIDTISFNIDYVACQVGNYI